MKLPPLHPKELRIGYNPGKGFNPLYLLVGVAVALVALIVIAHFNERSKPKN